MELIYKKTKTKRYDGVTRNVIGVYWKRKKMFPKYININKDIVIEIDKGITQLKEHCGWRMFHCQFSLLSRF